MSDPLPPLPFARMVGKGFLAAGFLSGVYGLTDSGPVWIRAGLILIAVGVLALAYGLLQGLWSRPRGDVE